jgi:hypothetical protein
MEMEANKEMDKQLDYEEEFVFLDLEDSVYSDIPPNAPFVLFICSKYKILPLYILD